MQKPNLMYFSAEGQTFYLDTKDTELNSQHLNKLMYACDYCFYQNKYGHWQFAKNRTDGDCTSEYFELKDLLNEIPLHHQYQNRKTLNRCKYIAYPTHVQQIVDIWAKARKDLNDLRTPWYEQ